MRSTSREVVRAGRKRRGLGVQQFGNDLVFDGGINAPSLLIAEMALSGSERVPCDVRRGRSHTGKRSSPKFILRLDPAPHSRTQSRSRPLRVPV